jgi:hypothetical protein
VSENKVVDTALVTLFSIGLSAAITIPFRYSLGVMNMAQRTTIEVLTAIADAGSAERNAAAQQAPD